MEEILRQLKIDYTVVGDEAIACCPAHEERHPSWSVNLKSGMHHCFACGFSGTIDSLAAHVLNLGYAEAHMWVASKVGWLAAAYWRENHRTERSYSPAYLQMSERDLSKFTAPPDDVLVKRKLTLEAAVMHGIMWNPERLSWILPIRDPYTDDLWGWQEKGTVDGRYRNFPAGVKKSRALFGIQALEHGSTAILVESPLDVVRFSAAGIRGAVSSYGVQVSDYQLSVIHRRSEHLVLALDNDSAGVAETSRVCRDFNQIPVSVFSYGNVTGKDPGELSDNELREGLANAESKLRRTAKHYRRADEHHRTPDSETGRGRSYRRERLEKTS